MAVEAENLVEQFLAKAIHHRHHDDEGGNAEHDPEEGKSGDNGDESLTPPRAQITQRQHPFERSEWMGSDGLAHRPGPKDLISSDSGCPKPQRNTACESRHTIIGWCGCPV